MIPYSLIPAILAAAALIRAFPFKDYTEQMC